MSNQVEIPIEQFTDFVCNSKKQSDIYDAIAGNAKPICQSKTFSQVLLVKTYKGFLSRGKLILAHIPVLKCDECGAIHNLNEK